MHGHAMVKGEHPGLWWEGQPSWEEVDHRHQRQTKHDERRNRCRRCGGFDKEGVKSNNWLFTGNYFANILVKYTIQLIHHI